MPSCEKLKEYEVAKERVEKREDFISSLEIIINEYKKDKDAGFRVWANVLDDIKEEIEDYTSGDVEIVDKYEQEEHDDEVKCMNEHEF